AMLEAKTGPSAVRNCGSSEMAKTPAFGLPRLVARPAAKARHRPVVDAAGGVGGRRNASRVLPPSPASRTPPATRIAAYAPELASRTADRPAAAAGVQMTRPVQVP